MGEDGFGFATNEFGKGPLRTASPSPIATYKVLPCIANPEGPDGSLLGAANPAGRPSIKVRRTPELGSMIDTRPVFGPFPPSATRRLFLVERMIFAGTLRPVVRTETGHCAIARLLPKATRPRIAPMTA